MRRKDVFGVLVNDEPRMRWKGVPGSSEGEFLSQLLRTKVDEIESSWPAFQSVILHAVKAQGRYSIHLPPNHLNPSRLSHPATPSIASNEMLTAHGMLLAMYIDKDYKHAVLVLDMG